MLFKLGIFFIAIGLAKLVWWLVTRKRGGEDDR